jgi:hypothetical protein
MKQTMSLNLFERPSGRDVSEWSVCSPNSLYLERGRLCSGYVAIIKMLLDSGRTCDWQLLVSCTWKEYERVRTSSNQHKREDTSASDVVSTESKFRTHIYQVTTPPLPLYTINHKHTKEPKQRCHSTQKQQEISRKSKCNSR